MCVFSYSDGAWTFHCLFVCLSPFYLVIFFLFHFPTGTNSLYSQWLHEDRLRLNDLTMWSMGVLSERKLSLVLNTKNYAYVKGLSFISFFKKS